MREASFVSAGVAMIAVTYGLARSAYGLFVPELREEFGLSSEAVGMIGAGSYVSYCFGIAVAAVASSRLGPRFVVVAAGLVAVAGMAGISAAVSPWMLAVGVLAAGISTGLASPPLADAVAGTLAPESQNRAQTFMNSGTGFGVMLSGPVALLAAGEWRLAWLAFAMIGAVVTVWSGFVVPGGKPRTADETMRFSIFWLVCPRSAPLFASAFAMGVSVSAYWTFSRDLVVHAGLSQFTSTVFWVVIGVSGIVGAATGDLVTRFGLRKVLPFSLLAVTAATGLLAAAPGNPVSVFNSAALFGAAHILITGLLLLWAVEIFRDRPSAGLGAAFLLLSAGQATGSIAAGMLAGWIGLEATFAVSASVAAATALIKPRPEKG